MKSVQDQYSNAPHYDYEYADLTADIDFTVWLARDFARVKEGKILEFCSGTGRVTFPLAEAGFDVTGVDITPAMLDIAKKKLPDVHEMQSRVKLVEGDMRTVDVGQGEYDLVLIPFNSLLHMLTPEDQLAALKNAWRHLRTGGYFLADIFMPNVERLGRNMGPSWLEVEKTMQIEQEGTLLVRSGSFSYAPHTQTVSATWQYQVFELAGNRRLLETYWSPLEMRVIFPGEWQLLLEAAGFRISQKWGSFDRQDFGENSDRMLFLCRKDAWPAN